MIFLLQECLVTKVHRYCVLVVANGLSIQQLSDVILARICPCPITNGHIPNSTSYLPYPHENASVEVIDIAMISAVVGRFDFKARTYILDRTDGNCDCVIPPADM